MMTIINTWKISPQKENFYFSLKMERFGNT